MTGAGDFGEDRFTRSTSLRLALIGAASLSLGLWKAPVAGAQDLGKCIAYCVDSYNEGLQNKLRLCQTAFAPATLAKNPRWRRFRRRLRVTPIGWKSVVDQLRSNCYAKAHNEYNEGLKNCQRKCRNTCPRRSVQSTSSTNAPTCQVTPPSKPSPPHLPPPPTTEDSYCSLCGKGAPTAYCDGCPSAPSGNVCCYLKAEGGVSPCCR